MGTKEAHIIERLTVTDIATNGKCIARHENKVVFVTNSAPGDVADVRITREAPNFLEGQPIYYHERSTMRQEPFCEHFSLCGGCQWQHISYEHQATLKGERVFAALERMGKVQIAEKRPILGSTQTRFYRNKLNYSFSHKCWIPRELHQSGTVTDRRGLGFHVPGRFEMVFDVNKCWLQEDFSNEVRVAIREFAKAQGLSFYNLKKHKGFLRSLTIRTASTGEKMLLMQFAENDPAGIEQMMNFIATKFPKITALLYVINPKEIDTYFDLDIVCYRGRDHIFEEMEGLQFKIGPKSFYQTNSEQAYALYKVARDFAQITKDDIVYDLYTGTGTIANFVARQAKKVVGVEYVPEAIEDAKANSRLNDIENTTFYAGDMKDLLTEQFIASNGTPDIIITDPPRAGMHEDVIAVLQKIAAPRIVYISCNPNTMARDLKALSDLYDVKIIQPVDMFPHTGHMECVGVLELRERDYASRTLLT